MSKPPILSSEPSASSDSVKIATYIDTLFSTQQWTRAESTENYERKITDTFKMLESFITDKNINTKIYINRYLPYATPIEYILYQMHNLQITP